MKITKRMVVRAENAHFRTEDYPSLVKQHAYNALYYKQQGKTKMYKYFTSEDPEVKRMVVKLEKKKDPIKRKVIVRRSRADPFNFGVLRS